MNDNKYTKLVIVYLKHIHFISTITEILPVSFMFDWQICITLSLLVCLWLHYAIQMNRTVTCNSNTYISNLGELTKQISKVLSRFDKMVSAWFLAGPDSRSVF